MKEKLKFIGKVTVAHIVSYTICGMIFMQIFDYMSFIQNNTAWRSLEDDWIIGLALLFQIVRGALFGVVLLLMKDCFMDKKLGWLKLWAIIAILCLFNTSSPCPGSIEGFVYLVPPDEPLRIKLGGMLEILTQTLLFSLIVTFKRPKTIINQKSKMP
jgi:hypothetical protein